MIVGQVLTPLFFGIWTMLYIALDKICPHIFKSYKSLNSKNKIEWNSRLISTIQAILTSIVSIYAIFSGADIYVPRDGFERKFTTPALICSAMTLGYWCYDVLLILIHWDTLGDVFGIIHHIVSIIPFGFGMVFGELVLYGPFTLLTEMSTPFVNQRWHFYVTKNTSGLPYAINGILMWLTFLIFRVLWLPCVLYFAWLNRDGITSCHALVAYPMVIGTIAILCLSLYWFSLITKGMIKTLKKQKRQ